MVMFRDPMHRHTAEDGKLSIDEKLSVLIPAIHHLDRRRHSTASILSASSSILSWIVAWFLFKSLKRHLAVRYGASPDGYREKWGLKPDYPMIAPTYAAQRSTLAKAAGLGRKPQPIFANNGSANRRPKA
ncbi:MULTISPECIES: MucR family transcriptional regulator [unclassified Mesorhizobium]|uniref:MucR family transcriptional regulator n=1 Tax=unclassified Mesorhizobium TaxID=325217 RepID=UPI0019351134|nr:MULTISPECIES: MucR family transcriptional regulator [unclassified Mesorhizobium]BCG86543.1 hypothetical protein MesoLj113c_26530 [Mesorhizobium sp. 113-3-9]